jgi:hypothetical protein
LQQALPPLIAFADASGYESALPFLAVLAASSSSSSSSSCSMQNKPVSVSAAGAAKLQSRSSHKMSPRRAAAALRADVLDVESLELNPRTLRVAMFRVSLWFCLFVGAAYALIG